METSASDLRRRFLAFFEERGHTVVPSAPLVPDDPTLLFANAGMVPFKDTFLGLEDRPYQRAASSQKCLRVTGKHNDLETVGRSPRHHTFFEMLGNFSFGDYFKPEAIRYAWDFLVDEMGLPPDRLIHTVHRDDDAARRIWLDEIGVDPARVLSMGDTTNFWMMADVGPCGPTSEIHYDFGPEYCTCGEPECSVALDNDCGRWLEAWNLVFMQYDQAADGTRTPLPSPGVDTGMGLERLSAVMQGVYSNYETDIFVPIVKAVADWVDVADVEGAGEELTVAFRVLADHGRSMTFLVADGVLPGNDGRNYVLRLIMRRAMRFGQQIGLTEPFLARLCDVVIDVMGDAYPELPAKQAWIREVVSEEEARFQRTLDAGLERLDEVIDSLRSADKDRIPGDEVFRLYDTYGFPPDLTRVVAEERGLAIDRDGFETAMEAQRERARAGGTFGVEAAGERYRRMDLPETRFEGYGATQCEGRVVSVVFDDHSVEAVEAGQSAEVVLDRTPFYAEAGGQVGDTGRLVGPSGEFQVTDTRSPVKGAVVHHGRVTAGTLRLGDTVQAEVDSDRRLDIMRNHTATHLLHAALQATLGEHAQQRGSLVAPDRLRFDFAHLRALTDDEIVEVERRVNAMIRADASVDWQTMSLDEAKQLGAMMLFGEKYGDTVRVVRVAAFSQELCGGTHLAATGEIGAFVITGEGSVGSGIRRLEAQTGPGAERYIRDRLALLERIADRVGSQTVDRILDRIDELESRARGAERELEGLRGQLARTRAGELTDDAVQVAGVTVLASRVEASDTDALRQQVDVLRSQLGPSVIVLGTVIDGNPRLVAAVADELVDRGLHAGHLIRDLASKIGGGGGGRPQLAEAGGRDTGGLQTALDAVPEHVREQLEADVRQPEGV